MTRYTHTMCMAFGADGEPDRVEVDATFDYLVAGSAVSDIRVLKIDGRAVAVADADLHDRIHDDLESGRFDDLLISLATPSPQSVVVPVEPTRDMWAAGGTAVCQTANQHHDKVVEGVWSAMLAAAPAPSSLAGGEVSRAVDHLTKRLNKPGAFHLSDQTSIRAILAALSPEAPAREGGTFQDRCGAWLDVCFGPESRADIPHRNARFLEEAVELVQAAGMGESAAVDVVRYVFTRPQGDINQEVGGVMMTLAAHCLATGVDMGTAAEAELARVWTKVDAIREKESAKPTFAALTPRHEAPECDDCGILLNSDGECTRDLAEREADDRHEAPASEGDRLTAEQAWADLLEKADRNSPVDSPMLFITREEMADYMNRAKPQSCAVHADAKERAIDGLNKALAVVEHGHPVSAHFVRNAIAFIEGRAT